MNEAKAIFDADPNALIKTLGFGSKKIHDFESLKNISKLEDNDSYKFMKLYVKKGDEKKITYDRDKRKNIIVSNFHIDYLIVNESQLFDYWNNFEFFIIDDSNNYEANVVKSITFK
jgi:hypothetical protein